jgi:hypothetical protein
VNSPESEVAAAAVVVEVVCDALDFDCLDLELLQLAMVAVTSSILPSFFQLLSSLITFYHFLHPQSGKMNLD